MKNKLYFLSFIATLLLGGCGGGSTATTAATTSSTVPSGVTLAAGNAKVTPSWTAVSGATSYNVYYKTSAGVTLVNSTKIAAASSGTAITGLVNDTTYYVAVTAVTSAGESALSSEKSATPAAPIAVGPMGVAVGVGNASLPLSWKSVAGATSYNVYYKTSAGVTKANSTKVTGAINESPITGLVNGTKYYFVVTSVTANVESTISEEVSATPQAGQPGITAGIAISSGQGRVTLKWLAVTGATSYNVYYGIAAGVTTASATKITGDVSGITPAGLTLTGLSNSTQYYFIITAVDAAANEYPASTEVAATTTAAIPNFMGGAIQTPLTLSGNVTTIAGTVGAWGSTDGVGVAASFLYAEDITTDGTNLYVSASANGSTNKTIRKIEIATGDVKTLVVSATGNLVSLNPSYAWSTITTDGSFIYTFQNGYGLTKLDLATGSHSILVYCCSSNWIQGLTTDGVNVYGTTGGTGSQGGTVFKVAIATGTLTTLAGNPVLSGNLDGSGSIALFNNPQGITTDGTYLYVTDTDNQRIRKVEIATGVVSTVAGGGSLLTYDGTGAAAKFVMPTRITTDGTNLYVTDRGTHTIRKIVIATNAVTTIAGTELTIGSTDALGRTALFNTPRGIITDGTSLYITDTENYTIRKIQ